MKGLRFLQGALALLIMIVSPAFVSSAQGNGEGELQVHVTQVDASDFPAITVYVSVTDQAGEPVGVEPDRILLEEDGEIIRPDQMQGLTGVVEKLTTLLVIDVSGSMNSADKLDTAKMAAKAYIEQMRPGDQVGLMSFNTTVTYNQPVVSDLEMLTAAIERLIAEEDTAMYDALVEAADMLATVPGRKAIIVLTDGMDNVSSSTLDDVLAHIGPSGMTISTIGLGDPEVQDATTAGIDEPALTLLATQAGGQYAYINDSAGLTALYERYARVLQSEYVIRYTTPGGLRDGLWRHLTVRLADAEALPQEASYNPGGLVPEVGEPASWPVFYGSLGGLVALLFLPTVVGRFLALIGIASGIGTRKKKPRIRFK